MKQLKIAGAGAIPIIGTGTGLWAQETEPKTIAGLLGLLAAFLAFGYLGKQWAHGMDFGFGEQPSHSRPRRRRTIRRRRGQGKKTSE